MSGEVHAEQQARTSRPAHQRQRAVTRSLRRRRRRDRDANAEPGQFRDGESRRARRTSTTDISSSQRGGLRSHCGPEIEHTSNSTKEHLTRSSRGSKINKSALESPVDRPGTDGVGLTGVGLPVRGRCPVQEPTVHCVSKLVVAHGTERRDVERLATSPQHRDHLPIDDPRRPRRTEKDRRGKWRYVVAIAPCKRHPRVLFSPHRRRVEK